MTDPHSSNRGDTRPPGAAGALLLALLAMAAFCGWYLVEWDQTDDSQPLRVLQKPIMPPTTTDLSSETPAQTHYTIIEPKDHPIAKKQP